MTTNVVNELGDKWLPFPPEGFFTMQRAPDMWFGDELPPTIQALMASPFVTQAKMMAQVSLRQSFMDGQIAAHQQRRYRSAVSRVGGKRKRN